MSFHPYTLALTLPNTHKHTNSHLENVWAQVVGGHRSDEWQGGLVLVLLDLLVALDVTVMLVDHCELYLGSGAMARAQECHGGQCVCEHTQAHLDSMCRAFSS